MQVAAAPSQASGWREVTCEVKNGFSEPPLVGMKNTPRTFQRRTYTVTETAELLGISRSTAYDLVSKGELHAIRLGRRWVVPVSTVSSIIGPSPMAAAAE